MFEWILISGIVFVSAAGTAFILKYAPYFGLLQAPNDRSSHTKTMPNVGGLSFAVVSLVSLVFLFLFDHIDVTYFAVLAGCGGIIATVGLWDDIGHLAIRWRLLIQFLCVGTGVLLVGGFLSDQIGNPIYDLGFIGFGLAVFLLVWWLNLFNFMDGIDGLAGLEAIFIALGAIVIMWLGDWNSVSDMSSAAKLVELLLLILAASVFGFLVFNWPPAKLFMGDVGSTFLGFTLGMIALVSVVEGVISLWIWLILGGIFWVDATLTLLRRMVSGQRWYAAHRSHAYQHATLILKSSEQVTTNGWITRWVNLGDDNSHKRVCVMVLIINLFWLLPMAFVALLKPQLEILITVAAWIPLLWLAFHLGAGKRDYFE